MSFSKNLQNIRFRLYNYLKDILDSLSAFGKSTMLAPGLIFLLIFFFMPMLLLALISFQTAFVSGTITNLTFGNYLEIFRDQYFINTLIRTLMLGVAVSATTLVLGYPIAYHITRTRSSRKRLIFMLLVLVPYLTSVVVRTFGWLIILLENGLLNTFLRHTGLIDGALNLVNNGYGIYIGLVHVFLPIAVITLMTSLGKIDRELEAAARDLGSSRIKVITQVLLPLSLQGILSGFLLVFALTVASYTTPSILGGTTSVMATSIYTYVGYLTDFPLAAALAMILMICATAVIAISNYMGSQRSEVA